MIDDIFTTLGLANLLPHPPNLVKASRDVASARVEVIKVSVELFKVPDKTVTFVAAGGDPVPWV